MAESAKPEAPKTAPAIDPEVLQRSLAEIAERSAKIAADFVEHQPQAEVARNLEDLGVNRAFMELGAKFFANPVKVAEMQLRAWDDYMHLWKAMVTKAAGGQAEPVKEPARGDNRFKSELWHNNFVFDYIKQSYLLAADHVQRAVADTQGLDPQTARKVKFFTRQYIDALSPTNFVLTNPDVLKTTAETGGANLLKGLEHLLKDLERGHGKLAISMTDYDAFKLGENVATTPGKVVYQNDLMQLLQYEPTTARVDRTPLLICPPWINKYYILDLRAKNSFIKWAVDRGLTVFVISWVNPDERHVTKGFGDYLLEGPVAALDAIERATGEKSVNLIGYCLGGTLSACLMSWLEARDEAERVKSVTYFTTMIDFTEPGELGVFVDESTVAKLEERMAQRGYLEGEEMAGTFNMLRDNDLIWSFVVNNYLLGKEPFPFDLLYWNSDATRLPAKMQTFYLRNMYVSNRLKVPGAVELCGVPLDLSAVDTPTYFISTMEDHIAPWKSTYQGARLFSGPVRFVLGGSGHIAGIVNPPSAQKYCYWTRDTLDADPDQWLAAAQRHEGSWWDDWGTWVAGFGGGKVDARVPGDRGLKVIEPAPGSYAKFRLDAQPKGKKGAAPATPATAPAPTAKAAPTAAPPAKVAPAPAVIDTAPAKAKKAKAPKPAEAVPATAPKEKKAKKAKKADGDKAKKSEATPTRKAKQAAVVKSQPVAMPAPAKTAAPAARAKPAKARKAGKSAEGPAGSPAELISALFRAQTPGRRDDEAEAPAPSGKAKGKKSRKA